MMPPWPMPSWTPAPTGHRSAADAWSTAHTRRRTASGCSRRSALERGGTTLRRHPGGRSRAPAGPARTCARSSEVSRELTGLADRNRVDLASSWAPASTVTTSRPPSTPSSRGSSSPRPTRPTSRRSARARSRPSTSSSRCWLSSSGCPWSRLRTTTAPRPPRRQRSWPCGHRPSPGAHQSGRALAMPWRRHARTSLPAPSVGGAADRCRWHDRPGCPGGTPWPAPAGGRRHPRPAQRLRAAGAHGPRGRPGPRAGALYLHSPISRAVLAGRAGASWRVRRGHRGRGGAAAGASPPGSGGPTSACWRRSQPLLRQVPGRLVGRTAPGGPTRPRHDAGPREQDIRRDKAATYICANQALARSRHRLPGLFGPRGLVT